VSVAESCLPALALAEMALVVLCVIYKNSPAKRQFFITVGVIVALFISYYAGLTQGAAEQYSVMMQRGWTPKGPYNLKP